MYYVYVVDNYFIKVNKNLKLSKTKNIQKAFTWNNKKLAKTWINIIHKYPNAILKEAILTLKN